MESHSEERLIYKNQEYGIRYQIPEDGFVQLEVFDMLEREVASLVNSEHSKGIHNIDFDASSLGRQISSGMYIYQI